MFVIEYYDRANQEWYQFDDATFPSWEYAFAWTVAYCQIFSRPPLRVQQKL